MSPSFLRLAETCRDKLKLLRLMYGRPAAAYQTHIRPQTFHQFSRLPDELQIIIWQFALLNGRVIKFVCEGHKNNSDFSRLVPVSSHPLLITTIKSREVSLAGLLDSMYSISSYRSPKVRFTGLPVYRYSTPFNPDRDTLLFPDRWVLYHLEDGYGISPECLREPLGIRELSSVKRVAIGGFQMPTVLESNDWSLLDEDIDAMLETITRFSGLEELILVRGSCLSWRLAKRFAERLIARWDVGLWAVRHWAHLAGFLVRLFSKTYGNDVQRSIQQYGRGIRDKIQPPLLLTPKEATRQTEQWLKTMVQSWLHPPQRTLNEHNQRAMRRVEGSAQDFRPFELSEWWRNPKIRIMTKKEFKKHRPFPDPF